ncbi:5292_t:CDS:2 [Acaulospora colombiana]|uniref:5292_t:CDS:1 n=1 Tax=Acaulospora colombiana TaxID=27376 RepID=A0ACA9KFD0_9GLOM|nr:5292_t:CDS:2 [Acaulospora colombiana]
MYSPTFLADSRSNSQRAPISNLSSKQRVAYFHNKDVGAFHFGPQHPMKPERLTLTNDLVLGYRLHEKMDVFCPPRATDEELMEFHQASYINFLKKITPENAKLFPVEDFNRFNINEDCPIFAGLYDYCQLYAGASVAAAERLASGASDICINWSGGLHHAKQFEASGFCFVNDIVLAIQHLLRLASVSRYVLIVLYVDIDIHHGDGVQEAFYLTDRVMTVSFHKYDNGNYFPGTGDFEEIGTGFGKYFSLNVPLKDGMDDESYIVLFKDIITAVRDRYRPSAIVLQSGADSLGKDKLGGFNLSIKAHGECVRYIKSWQIPLLVLGGGGYMVQNVARCWAYETSILVDTEVPEELSPDRTNFYALFGPDYSLHPPLVGKVENQNTKSDLQKLAQQVLEHLKALEGAPSVQMQEIPTEKTKEAKNKDEELADSREDANADYRYRRRLIWHDNEYFDGENDHDRDDERQMMDDEF